MPSTTSIVEDDTSDGMSMLDLDGAGYQDERNDDDSMGADSSEVALAQRDGLHASGDQLDRNHPGGASSAVTEVADAQGQMGTEGVLPPRPFHVNRISVGELALLPAELTWTQSYEQGAAEPPGSYDDLPPYSTSQSVPRPSTPASEARVRYSQAMIDGPPAIPPSGATNRRSQTSNSPNHGSDVPVVRLTYPTPGTASGSWEEDEVPDDLLDKYAEILHEEGIDAAQRFIQEERRNRQTEMIRALMEGRLAPALLRSSNVTPGLQDATQSATQSHTANQTDGALTMQGYDAAHLPTTGHDFDDSVDSGGPVSSAHRAYRLGAHPSSELGELWERGLNLGEIVDVETMQVVVEGPGSFGISRIEVEDEGGWIVAHSEGGVPEGQRATRPNPVMEVHVPDDLVGAANGDAPIEDWQRLMSSAGVSVQATVDEAEETVANAHAVEALQEARADTWGGTEETVANGHVVEELQETRDTWDEDIGSSGSPGPAQWATWR